MGKQFGINERLYGFIALLFVCLGLLRIDVVQAFQRPVRIFAQRAYIQSVEHINIRGRRICFQCRLCFLGNERVADRLDFHARIILAVSVGERLNVSSAVASLKALDPKYADFSRLAVAHTSRQSDTGHETAQQ